MEPFELSLEGTYPLWLSRLWNGRFEHL